MRVIVGTLWRFRGLGGVRPHVEELVKCFQARGIEHGLLSSASRYDSVAWRGFAVLRSGCSLDRGRVRLTAMRTADVKRKLAAAGNYDLVHGHDVAFGLAAAGLGVLPVVLTVHGPFARELDVYLGRRYPAFSAFARVTESSAYARARAIITVDSGQKAVLVRDYGVPQERVRVILNAVDTDLFSPGPAGSGPGAAYFLVPRRLVLKNGVRYAVTALRAVRESGVQLWVAGDGPERQELEALARALGVAGQVRFLGWVARRDLVDLIRGSLGVIVPSVSVAGVVEATSMAALEAMSTGKAVFASNIGGLAEIIQPGVTGFLFEEGNADALGEHLRLALASARPDLERIESNARRHVIQRHGLAAWFDSVLAVYRDALSEPGEAAMSA